MIKTKATKLQIALADLIALLREASDVHWVKVLEEIERDLEDPTRQKQALRQLGACFGGMGSLNDLYFSRQYGSVPEGESEENFNKSYNLKANRVFKELRLFRIPWIFRILWNALEWIYRADPPPRVKNSFRRN